MEQIRSLPFGLAVVVLFCIVMARANATYWVGRAAVKGGERSARIARHLSGRRVQRAQRMLARLGIAAVPLSFLTVGVQTAVNLTAGVSRMPLRWYLPAVSVGCVLWALLYVTVGMVGVEVAWRVLSGA